MEFIFRVTDYQDSALEGEAAELLRQRLERHSREVLPETWKAIDTLNAHAAKGPGREARQRRHRICGVLLIALGVFALVPGLAAEPRIPSLIMAGGAAVLWGVWILCLREQRSLQPPASCKKEAAALLRERRETDWASLQAEVRFDEAGWSVHTMEGESRTDYGKLQSVFETERLWLLVCEKDKALLLQKKDLITGAAADFLPCLREIINKNHVS